MNSNWKQKVAQPKKLVERMNACRAMEEQELIQYGMAGASRILAVAINHKKHIAKSALIEILAYAEFLYETEFRQDAEYATEQMDVYLNKIMGEGWEKKVIALREKMIEEWRNRGE